MTTSHDSSEQTGRPAGYPEAHINHAPLSEAAFTIIRLELKNAPGARVPLDCDGNMVPHTPCTVSRAGEPAQAVFLYTAWDYPELQSGLHIEFTTESMGHLELEYHIEQSLIYSINVTDSGGTIVIGDDVITFAA